MIGIVTGLLTHKLAGPIAAAGCVALTLALVFSVISGKAHERRADRLADQIDNPSTGWRARLSTCRSSVLTLDQALARQSAAVRGLEDIGRTLTAENERLASTAQKSASAAQAASRRVAAKPPVGIDTCSRVLDVDRKMTEALG